MERKRAVKVFEPAKEQLEMIFQEFFDKNISWDVVEQYAGPFVDVYLREYLME